MTDKGAAHSVRIARHGTHRAHRGRVPRWAWLLIAALLVIFLAGAWIAVRGLIAKGELEAALPLARRIQEQVVVGDTVGASQTLVELQHRSASARALTSDFVWRAAEGLPWAGGNLRVVRELTEVVDDLASEGIQPLAELAGELNSSDFNPANHAIALQPLVDAAPAVVAADDAIAAAREKVRGIRRDDVLSVVRDAANELQGSVEEAAEAVSSVRGAIELLPSMLGADGPRSYLLLVQNPAELRSGGGVIGAMALITADGGRVDLVQQASSLDFEPFAEPVLPLPPETRSLFGDRTGEYIQNVTLTPQFVLSGSLAREMWRQKYGVEVDGVIAIDPVALSYLLKATGPIVLPTGDQLTSDNAVQLLLHDVYSRYPEPTDQDAFFAAAASGVFDQVANGAGDAQGLIGAFATAGHERRVVMWLADPSAQAILADSTLSGSLPASDTEATRIGLYFNEAGGTKMDYYLKREISVGTAVCRNDGLRALEVDVTLTNTTQPGEVFPDYVTAYGQFGVPAGNIKNLVSIYAPEGSINQGVSDVVADRSLQALPATQTTDSGYVVSQTSIELAPGESRTVRFSMLLDPSKSPNIEMVATPGVYQPVTEQSSISC